MTPAVPRHLQKQPCHTKAKRSCSWSGLGHERRLCNRSRPVDICYAPLATDDAQGDVETALSAQTPPSLFATGNATARALELENYLQAFRTEVFGYTAGQ
jgi:hypothetical protein